MSLPLASRDRACSCPWCRHSEEWKEAYCAGWDAYNSYEHDVLYEEIQALRGRVAALTKALEKAHEALRSNATAEERALARRSSAQALSSVREEDRDCERCNGKGYLPASFMDGEATEPCDECKGSGVREEDR